MQFKKKLFFSCYLWLYSWCNQKKKVNTIQNSNQNIVWNRFFFNVPKLIFFIFLQEHYMKCIEHAKLIFFHIFFVVLFFFVHQATTRTTYIHVSCFFIVVRRDHLEMWFLFSLSKLSWQQDKLLVSKMKSKTEKQN